MSYASVQDAFDILTTKMGELEESVAQIREAAELPDKKKLERESRKVYNAARAACNNLKKEVAKVDDPTQKSVFARKQQQSEDRLKAYDGEMRKLIRPVRQRVDNEEAAMAKIMGTGEAGGLETASKTMDAVIRAQEDNLDILKRVERETVVIEAIGNEVAVNLGKDTEKIQEIDKELNTLQANIDRAKGEVMWFARRMSTDKCFICLMLMVIIGICVLVFWKLYSDRMGGGNSDTPAPETRAPTETLEPPPTPTSDPSSTVAAAAVLARLIRRTG